MVVIEEFLFPYTLNVSLLVQERAQLQAVLAAPAAANREEGLPAAPAASNREEGLPAATAAPAATIPGAPGGAMPADPVVPSSEPLLVRALFNAKFDQATFLSLLCRGVCV
jgi:hypothetical protein